MKKNYVDISLQMSKGYEKTCIACKFLSKGNFSREEQVDRMMHSVDIRFFPRPSLSFSNGFMSKEAMVH